MNEEQVYISQKSFDNITLKEFLYEYANVKIQDNWSATADYYVESTDSACGNTIFSFKESGVQLNLSENVYLEDYDLWDALWEFMCGEHYTICLEKDTIIQMDDEILEGLEEMWADDEEQRNNLCMYFKVEVEEEEMETFNEAPYGTD